jgi:homoserine kinase
VNGLFGSILSKAQLVQAGLESEATVSGYHADNVAPSLMGGFILVRSYTPLHLIPLAFPEDKPLVFVLVIPEFEAPTKEMRAVLPKEVMLIHSQENGIVSGSLPGEMSSSSSNVRTYWSVLMYRLITASIHKL